MPDEAPTQAEQPTTSRIEHVKAGEQDKLTAKKIPTWGYVAIAAGAAIVFYIIWKKRQSSTSSTSETPTAYSTEGYPYGGYAGGGYGYGGSEQNSSLQAAMSKWEEEQANANKKWREEEEGRGKKSREESESGIKKWEEGIENIVKSFKPSPPPETPTPTPTPTPTSPTTTTTTSPTTTQAPTEPGEPPPYTTPEGALVTGNPAGPVNVYYPERLKKIEEEVAKAFPTSPQVNNPPSPSLPVVTPNPIPGGSQSCPATFPIKSTRGCYRPIRAASGAECHEYQNGTKECQHKVGNRWVW